MSSLAVTLIAIGAGAVLVKVVLVLRAWRRARRVEAQLEAMRERKRRKSKVVEDKLARPMDWTPSNDHLDTCHLTVRHEPDFVSKEK